MSGLSTRGLARNTLRQIQIAGPFRRGMGGYEYVEWALYAHDPHRFIFGHDGRYPVLTKDEHRVTDPEQPFRDLPYLRVLLDCLLVSGHFVPPTEAHYALDWGIPLAHLEQMDYQGVVFLEKSRQIMASWLCVAYLLWRAKFHAHQLILIQSKKEEDAAKFVYMKEPQQARMSFMESRLPDWMQDGIFSRKEVLIGRLPAPSRRGAEYGHLYFNNGSHVWGVPQGGSVVRSNTPSCLFSDECAFQNEFGASFQAAMPAIMGGGQLIAVSSPDLGDFAKLVEAPV